MALTSGEDKPLTFFIVMSLESEPEAFGLDFPKPAWPFRSRFLLFAIVTGLRQGGFKIELKELKLTTANG